MYVLYSIASYLSEIIHILYFKAEDRDSTFPPESSIPYPHLSTPQLNSTASLYNRIQTLKNLKETRQTSQLSHDPLVPPSLPLSINCHGLEIPDPYLAAVVNQRPLKVRTPYKCL